MSRAPLPVDRDEPPSPRSRIKELRALSGLTQSDFARACGIARTYVGLIESGLRKEIGVSKLAAIAITCGVTLDYLVLGELGDDNGARSTKPTKDGVCTAIQRAFGDRDGWREKLDRALGVRRRSAPRRRPALRAKPLARPALPADPAARAHKNEPPTMRAGGSAPDL